MKKILLFSILLIFSNMSYARLGRHNFQINLGGGYPETLSLNSVEINPGYSLKGGILTGEVGYLLHSVRKSGVIHGFDIRADFSISFLKATVTSNEVGIVTQDSTRLYGGLVMSYTLGRQLKSGRLMFDILGMGMAFGDTVTSRTGDFHTLFPNNPATDNQKPTLHIDMQYVLPGIQYIDYYGFTVGWRNKISIFLKANEGTGKFGVDTALTLGYTFGSGEQPWEK